MIEVHCDELLTTLSELRGILPQLRFGQLIANLATEARGFEPSAVWDVEDAELLATTKAFLAEVKERRPTPA